MTVLDYLRKATLYGVGIGLEEYIGLRGEDVAKQLIKAIDILTLKPAPSEGYVRLEYIEPKHMLPYYAVTGVYDDGDYCLALVPWDEWLSMPVHIDGPALTVDEIAALILYEMTPSGDPRGAK